MKKVSRGTSKPRPAYLAPWELDALAAGVMIGTRWPITPENSSVEPGKFADLDFDSGRAVRAVLPVELRCRCRFRSGAVRVAKVRPTIAARDLFWATDRSKTIKRAGSRFVLEVLGVDVARLQDMTDASALAYGAALLPDKLKETGTPRLWFARSRGQFWAANRWQWVVTWKIHRANVDDYLERLA